MKKLTLQELQNAFKGKTILAKVDSNIEVLIKMDMRGISICDFVDGIDFSCLITEANFISASFVDDKLTIAYDKNDGDKEEGLDLETFELINFRKRTITPIDLF